MPRLGDRIPPILIQRRTFRLLLSAAMSAKPTALEPSEPIAGPVPPALAETEAPAPQLRQRPTETAEVVAVPPDAKASELASAPPAVAPRTLDDAHPAYSDPEQDTSTAVSPVMAAKPAALEPSEPIAGPVPPAVAEAEAPQARQQPTETAEVAAVPPDVQASELASVPPAVAHADAGRRASRPFRSRAGHFDRCIPGKVCQARRTRTLRADRRANPTAQAEAQCHRRPHQPHGVIGAIAHRRK